MGGDSKFAGEKQNGY